MIKSMYSQSWHDTKNGSFIHSAIRDGSGINCCVHMKDRKCILYSISASGRIQAIVSKYLLGIMLLGILITRPSPSLPSTI